MDLIQIQNKIKNFNLDKMIQSKLEIRMIDIASEVGELAKEILKATDYGKTTFNKTEEWKNEIGDVLYSLICIANDTETNLEECILTTLDKYEKRFNKNGYIGSSK